jgi:hypothetical protein
VRWWKSREPRKREMKPPLPRRVLSVLTLTFAGVRPIGACSTLPARDRESLDQAPKRNQKPQSGTATVAGAVIGKGTFPISDARGQLL